MTALILFGLFTFLLFLSVPIAIGLGLASTAALLFSGKVSSSYVAQGLVTSIDSFPLMAVPFFILAGNLMSQGGLSERLLSVGKILFGRFNGGMTVIAVVTCMFFGAISGSGPATVAAVGAILLPAMTKGGYRPAFSTGLIASAGSLGIVIPPSIPMIIYASSANVSVTELFLAGIIPGLLIGIFLIAYAWFVGKRENVGLKEPTPTLGEALKTIYDAKWALLVPVIILGGIYGGVFTPTEAAAVAVFYGLIVGVFLYKELSLKKLYTILADSALITSTIMIIVGAATIFGRVLTIERIPVQLADYTLEIVSNPLLLLLLINVLLLVIGTFMETLAAIIILTPILLPIAAGIGVHPVHFGIIMIVNLAIGMITPPVGVNLFVASRVASLSLEKVMRSAAPFVIVMLVALLLITYLPFISLGLSNLINN